MRNIHIYTGETKFLVINTRTDLCILQLFTKLFLNVMLFLCTPKQILHA